MKLNWNKKYTTIAVYAFLVVVASLLFLGFVLNFSRFQSFCLQVFGYLKPVVYGFVFAYLLNPILRVFDDRLLPRLFPGMKPKPKRGLALLLTYLIVFSAVTLFVRVVVVQLVPSIVSISSKLNLYFLSARDWLNGIITRLAEFQVVGQSGLVETFVDELMGQIQQLSRRLFSGMYDLLTGSIVTVISTTSKITTAVLNFIIGVIISAYLLLDREKLFAQGKKLVIALLPSKIVGKLETFLRELDKVFSGFISGKILDSIIIGILCYIGLRIFQINYPELISVIIGVTNVIPYFGPFIGAIPSFFIILMVNPVKALIFLIFILLLQQFDGNILGPKILGDTTGLSAFWVLFSILLFKGLFGIVGMFIGVPLFAIIYWMCKKIIAYLLERKGLSTNTRDYDSISNKLLK